MRGTVHREFADYPNAAPNGRFLRSNGGRPTGEPFCHVLGLDSRPFNHLLEVGHELGVDSVVCCAERVEGSRTGAVENPEHAQLLLRIGLHPPERCPTQRVFQTAVTATGSLHHGERRSSRVNGGERGWAAFAAVRVPPSRIGRRAACLPLVISFEVRRSAYCVVEPVA